MPTPGYVFRDSGTTPPAEEENETHEKCLSAKSPKSPKFPKSQSSPTPSRHSKQSSRSPLQGKASGSHAIVVTDHDVKGAAQAAGRTLDVTDLGWRSPPQDVDTLVGKLPNEELWALVRRFNMQIFHLKAIPIVPPGGLDLNIADEDEFSPDKLRANIERLYMTVIVGLMAFGNFIARLRSWREPRRTAAACAAYFLGWLVGGLVPLSMSLLIVVITIPKSRGFLFPPAPIALVDSKTGGIQKPKAGVLGSHDTATGAPESHQGEAVEQEASNLVSGIASVALASAAGRHDQGDPEFTTKGEADIPDPTKMVGAATDSRTSAQGAQTMGKYDKTKQPMEEAVWAKMRPAMHAIGDIADGWERFANALSPTPPFPHTSQYQLAAVIAPLLLMSLFIKPAHVVNASTLLSGLIFFSGPLQQRGIEFLNQRHPKWPEHLQLRNTLLKGVPTNAQLTITLLRVGEANRAPLPPPPRSDVPPPNEAAEIDKTAITNGGLDASHSEIDDAIAPDTQSTSGSVRSSSPAKAKGGAGAKIVSLFKSTTAAGVDAKLGAIDKVRAAVGSNDAKEKLGILPDKAEMLKAPRHGPIEFKGRYQGTKGAIYLDSTVSPPSADRPASPCIYFSTVTTNIKNIKNTNNNNANNTNTNTSNNSPSSLSNSTTEPREEGQEQQQQEGTELNDSLTTNPPSTKKPPQWIISIADIAEVKKVGGMDWKGKLVVGWATDRAVKDGIEIVEKVRQGEGDGEGEGDDEQQRGRTWRVTAIKERNELFNRIVAIGGQFWESY